MKVTKKTKINELLIKKPELAGVLFYSGLGCVGCHMSSYETIEQGCKVHGMSDNEIDKLIKMLNEKKKTGGKKK